MLRFVPGFAVAIPTARSGWLVHDVAPPLAGLTTSVALANAATCFNQLKLPAWGSAAELASGMRLTLEFGGGFGLA